MKSRDMMNRLATWMLYVIIFIINLKLSNQSYLKLESPEMGGATVFPVLGVRADAIYRSAVFWYNTLPSGNGDLRTYHAGCPVILGSKWISNKWIHEAGEVFTRPCDLTLEPDEDRIDLAYDFL